MAALKVPVTTKDHIQGNDNSPITLVEYGDFQCPYCGLAYPEVKKLQSHFGDQIRFVFRHFPLTEVHPFAEKAAETSEFGAKHHRFWEVHDLIYENQQALSIPFLIELAKDLQLPSKELTEALDQQAYADKIQTDFNGGVRSGVNGTPTFFINGQRYDGEPVFEHLSEAINSLLFRI